MLGPLMFLLYDNDISKSLHIILDYLLMIANL